MKIWNDSDKETLKWRQRYTHLNKLAIQIFIDVIGLYKSYIVIDAFLCRIFNY